MAKREKKPKTTVEVAPTKTPKWQREPIIDGHGPLSWRFSSHDRGGPFPWCFDDANKLVDVVDRLCGYEQLNWQQILSVGSHPIEIADLCDQARQRLGEIDLDDLDELVSFRISGAERVWCIKDGSTMRVLWWDPNHSVYPVEPDKNDRRKRRKRS